MIFTIGLYLSSFIGTIGTLWKIIKLGKNLGRNEKPTLETYIGNLLMLDIGMPTMVSNVGIPTST